MATFRTSQPASGAEPGRAHLILVGLPGAGKSTVGSAAAERLRWAFLDLDREIERREGATIAELFAQQGEHYFRGKERELTLELRDVGGMVLAPGGGWITNPDVVALLRPPGRIIYLKTTPERALERLGAERATRPLLSRADPLAELHTLLTARAPLYESADHVVDTERLGVDEVVRQVVALA